MIIHRIVIAIAAGAVVVEGRTRKEVSGKTAFSCLHDCIKVQKYDMQSTIHFVVTNINIYCTMQGCRVQRSSVDWLSLDL